jgi:hypothetical protein
MVGSELLVVSAVAAYDHKELGAVLLGIGAAVTDRDIVKFTLFT